MSTNPPNTAWNPITNWATSPGYDNGTTTNGLVVPSDDVVTVNGTFTRVSTASNTWSLRLTLNGVMVGSSQVFTSSKTVSISAAGVSVVAGDVIGMDLQSLFAATNGAAEANTTYIEVVSA
ncbi:hypothetical protein [Rhodococcus sp. AG1013]|uniref:hypothetical protein n=1 Tax=Rhodococcus sp. AG1013 TaxID=2183996 RepID=UPI000E0C102D|nr:hypothetical protein [Rhodococcus sp. AG1013]